MTDSLAADLDGLDRACAEAMGWTVADPGLIEILCGCPPGKDAKIDDEWRAIPRPTRSWPDFGALLLWCAEKGLEPMVRYSNFNERGNEWHAVISKGTNSPTQISTAGPDPRVALCAAVKAWKASLTEAPRRGA